MFWFLRFFVSDLNPKLTILVKHFKRYSCFKERTLMTPNLDITGIDFTLASDISSTALDFVRILKRITNAITAIFVLLILSIPMIICVTLLWFIVFDLRRKQNKAISLDMSNYKQLRVEYNHLNSRLDSLKKGAELDLKNSHIIIRFALAPVCALSKMIIRRRDSIHDALSELNPPVVKNSGFMPVTEITLWNTRPVVAEYVL